MNYSIICLTAWQLAAKEAIAGRFKEIEPEHLFATILKISEIPMEALTPQIARQSDVDSIKTELQSLVSDFKARNIQTTEVRRLIRSLMGVGNYQHGQEPVHRSNELRRIFSAAELRTRNQGENCVHISCLLKELLQSATPIMTKVLNQERVDIAEPALLCPEQDLVHIALYQSIKADHGVNAAGLALYETIKQSRPVILIHNSEDIVRRVLSQAAARLANAENPAQYALYDMYKLLDHPAGAQYPADIWQQALTEITNQKHIYLYLPGLYLNPGNNEPDAWTKNLLACLRQQTLNFICRTDPAVFPRLQEIEPVLKRQAGVIWIHDVTEQELPSKI